MKYPRFKTFYIPFLIIGFLTGIISYRHSINLKGSHIAYLTPADKTIAALEGIIITQPEEAITKYKSKRLTFMLEASKIKFNHRWLDTNGLVKVNIYEAKQSFEYGDELIISGQIYSPHPAGNPGQFDYKLYLRRHNIYTLFAVNKNGQIISTGKNKANPLIYFLLKIKNRLNKLIESYLAYPENALLQALLLGSRAEIPQYLEDKFIQSGTVHILSVSGLHLALLCFILVIFFKAVNFPRKLYLILTMFLVVLYCLLTGNKPPIVRSTIMIEVFLFGLLILREANVYNSLALAALLILLRNPQELLDIGFQLSFISVFSIVYFTPKIEKLLNPPSIVDKIKPVRNNILIKFKKFFIGYFSVSLAAWLGTLILIIYYFNIFSPVTILANLFIVPLVTLIMAAGLVFLILGCLSPILALVFSSALDLFLKILLAGVIFFSNLLFAFIRAPSISIFTVAAYFCLLFLLFNYKKLRLSLGKLFIILILCLNFLIWAQIFKADNPNLRVTFLDVGHGDSIFIEFPHKGTMLIDGGLGGENDFGRWVISPFLWHKGIREIDALVLTHPHADHVGGLGTVVNNFKIKYAFGNARGADSWSYKNYIASLKSKNIRPQPLKAGDCIIGYPDVQIMVFNPVPDFFKKTAADENNNSLVLKIVFKNISFLLCADLETEGIRQILTTEQDLKANIIKIPHHGSQQGKEEEIFLGKVKPEIAVITVARYENNLPAPATLDILRKIGAKTYTTDTCGAITVTSDGYEYDLTTMLKGRKKAKNQL